MKFLRLIVISALIGMLASCAGMQGRQEPKAPIILLSFDAFPTDEFGGS